MAGDSVPEDAVVVGEAKCDESPLGGRKAYVAQCKDSSLRELLVEVRCTVSEVVVL